MRERLAEIVLARSDSAFCAYGIVDDILSEYDLVEKAEDKPQIPTQLYEVVPWTLETFPKDRPVWVRHKSNQQSGFMVIYTGPHGIATNGDERIEWHHLVDNYEQLDGSPCGERK